MTDKPTSPIYRARSNRSNVYHEAALVSSCQPPLPIYPPSEDEQPSPREDKEVAGLERSSTRGTDVGPSIDVPLSSLKKKILLGLFCLGVFMDVLCVCAFYILLEPVSKDLDIVFEEQTWIVTSFGLTFASFLLFWGRFSDLFSPKPVFYFSFLTFGLLNLIVSFLNDKYSFLILRALAGISAAALIPASYRLITAVFEKHELPRAFTVYSLSGSVAGASGVVMGGIMMLIPGTGQMHGWRWFFRMAAFIVIPTAIWSIWYIPTPRGDFGKEKGKWKRLDIVGTLLILAAILFFILSLTMGASRGWSNAKFIAPLIISIILFPAFFFWEAHIPARNALVPPSTWRAHNFTLWVLLAFVSMAWWTCAQIPMIELFVNYQNDKPIIAAVRLIPSGLFSVMSSTILIKYPIISTRPKLGYTLGQLGGMLGYGLFILGDGKTGMNYWKFYFPGLAIGSFFNNVSCTCIMVGAMTAVSGEAAGVVGGLVQAAIQAGNVIALTIQAGLLTIHPGGVGDFRNVTASWAFMIAFLGSSLVAFWVFHRDVRKDVDDEETVVAMH